MRDDGAVAGVRSPRGKGGRARRRKLARVNLRELFGKAPDDSVDEIQREVREALTMASAGNSLRHNFHPFALNFGGPEPRIVALPNGPTGRITAMEQLISLADSRSSSFLAVVAMRRTGGRWRRRLAAVFVEYPDGTALHITVPYWVGIWHKTRFQLASVTVVRPRVWSRDSRRRHPSGPTRQDIPRPVAAMRLPDAESDGDIYLFKAVSRLRLTEQIRGLTLTARNSRGRLRIEVPSSACCSPALEAFVERNSQNITIDRHDFE